MSRLIQSLGDALGRGRRFVVHDAWRVGLPGEEIPHGLIIRHIRVAILLVKGVVRDALPLRASSLTFATILSIVPFFAIMFFMIQTFDLGESLGSLGELLSPAAGGEGRSVSPAVPGVGETTSPAPPMTGEEKNRKLWEDFIGLVFRGFEQGSDTGAADTVVNPVKAIVHYAERGSNPRTLTLAGVVFVLTTVLGLMMNIETSFNTIWGIRNRRSWYRMLSDYIMVLILLPFLTAGVLSLTAILQSASVAERLGRFAVGLHGIQYAIAWVFFTALYFLVPNTRVRLRYALLAGIVAGTMWCLLSLAYVKFQFGLRNYNIVYATFAQVPLLLMWVYCSWLVLLFGAELTFAYQNEKTFAMERLAEGASHAYREAVGLWAMIELGKRFDAGLPGLSAEASAERWNVPLRLLNDTLRQLEEARLVVQCASNPPTYLPARSLEKIAVADILTCLRESGRDPSGLRRHNAFRNLLTSLEAGSKSAGSRTIADIIREMPGEDRRL